MKVTSKLKLLAVSAAAAGVIAAVIPAAPAFAQAKAQARRRPRRSFSRPSFIGADRLRPTACRLPTVTPTT